MTILSWLHRKPKSVGAMLAPQVLTDAQRDDAMLLAIADWADGGYRGDLAIQADQAMRLKNAGMITVTVNITDVGRRRARGIA